MHFSTKHRHVPLPARIPSPPRFVPVEFDRTLISQRGGKKSVFFNVCICSLFVVVVVVVFFIAPT